MRLKDRSALITGAGRGIGRAIAVAMAREGANLMLVARTGTELEDAATEIRGLGRNALVHAGDAADEKTARESVRAGRKAFGEIDILVNAAGINGPIGPVEEADPNEWRRAIDVNLTSAFLFIREILPFMKSRRYGKIVNLSGGGAANPRPRFSAYAVSKAALVRLTETVAEETKEFNVQVNALAPGAVNTRMFDEMLAARERVGPAEYQALRDRQKSGGARPDRAAELAVFLASGESGGLTGRMISAIWDDWNSWDSAAILKIQSSDLYTLRRLTPKK